MRSSINKQPEPSKKNRALSRGPVTPQEKRPVSKNAPHHGLIVVVDNKRNQPAASSGRTSRLSAIETRVLNQKLPNQNLLVDPQPHIAETNRMTASFTSLAASQRALHGLTLLRSKKKNQN
jgi:hypothetical protein